MPLSEDSAHPADMEGLRAIMMFYQARASQAQVVSPRDAQKLPAVCLVCAPEHQRCHMRSSDPHPTSNTRHDPITPASMELKDLSSNWKKLQATLPKKQANAPSSKRKATTITEPSPSAKRRKREPTKHTSVEKRRRATNMEEPKINGKGRPSASLALWAEDHDIPAADLAEAYGVSLNGTTLFPPTNSSDQINAGLSVTYILRLSSTYY